MNIKYIALLLMVDASITSFAMHEEKKGDAPNAKTIKPEESSKEETQKEPGKTNLTILSTAENFKARIDALNTKLDEGKIDVPTFIKEFDAFYTEYTMYRIHNERNIEIGLFLREQVEPTFRKLLTSYTNFSLD